ncbi:MAG: HAD family hydrolase [bacterium]|nr:HAD family hydrolase [bacterium]
MQPTATIKAIVFDWDGVIVDSMPTIALGIQETAASYGVQISAEKILATYFQPKEAFYKSLGIDVENKAKLNARHSSSDRKHLAMDPKLFSDVLPTLKELHEKGFVLGIATQRVESGVIGMQREIERNNLQMMFPFENIESGPRTKEEKLVALIKKFGVAPDELLYVGDLPSDITVAKKVGAKSAGIAREESGKPRLKAENPDYFLNSLADLLAI